MNDLCERLEWDSGFFGIPIGRVEVPRLTSQEAEQVVAWCRDERVECVYFLCDPSDRQSIRAAESVGLSFVDIRVTLERSIADFTAEPSRSTLRIARDSDLAALRSIASSSYHDSRFYADGRFPIEKCAELYATWIEKSCQGFADRVMVAEQDESIAGYIACKAVDPGRGAITLVAVAEHARGSGLGRDLVNAALEWAREVELSLVTVVTQGRNLAAQRLYQRCGFATREMQLWYHGWFL